MASGPVKIIASAKEIRKILSGDILVAEQTNPIFVPAMRKAVELLRNAAEERLMPQSCRELGIPAVVGAKGVIKLLKDGMVVTLNGSTGEIYKGSIAPNPVTVVKKSVDVLHQKQQRKYMLIWRNPAVHARDCQNECGWRWAFAC